MSSVTDGTPATAGASQAVGHSYFTTETRRLPGFVQRAPAKIRVVSGGIGLCAAVQGLTEVTAGVMCDAPRCQQSRVGSQIGRAHV